MKKKYLQACEVNGSIYGKKRTTDRKGSVEKKRGDSGDMISSYTKFYRSQVSAMYKVLHRDR
ncbi:MAG: hypothetical protein WBD00_02505 [Candidatus Omnitrophota bacterium]